MKNILLIQNKINSFKNSINISGDKSLSIRWAIMSAQALGKSKAFNLLDSEDVNNTLVSLKKLLKVLDKPYLEQENINNYQLPSNSIEKYQTFCGT